MIETKRAAAAASMICLLWLATAPPTGAIGPVDVTLSTNTPVSNVDAELHAPDNVPAGNHFSISGHLTLRAAGVAIVHVLPVPVVGPCTVTGIHVTGALPIAGDMYLITSEVTIYPMVDTVGDPPERPDHLVMTLQLDTSEKAAGTCNAGFQFSEVLSSVAGPLQALTKNIDIIDPPAIPVSLGTIQAIGGNDNIDRADTTVPAVPAPPGKFPIVVLTSNPRVQVDGTMSLFFDSNTINDWANFYITRNGVTLQHHTLHTATVGELLSDIGPLPHTPGQTVDTTYCFFGEYVDDGAWTTYEEPHAENCLIVSAQEPDPADWKSHELDEACAAWGQTSTQAMLLLYNQAMVPFVTKDSNGKTPVGAYMFDRAFGEACPLLAGL